MDIHIRSGGGEGEYQRSTNNGGGNQTYPSTAGQALEAELLGDLGGAHGVLKQGAISIPDHTTCGVAGGAIL
jgi:hypothetical protein